MMGTKREIDEFKQGFPVSTTKSQTERKQDMEQPTRVHRNAYEWR